MTPSVRLDGRVGDVTRPLPTNDAEETPCRITQIYDPALSSECLLRNGTLRKPVVVDFIVPTDLSRRHDLIPVGIDECAFDVESSDLRRR